MLTDLLFKIPKSQREKPVSDHLNNNNNTITHMRRVSKDCLCSLHPPCAQPALCLSDLLPKPLKELGIQAQNPGSGLLKASFTAQTRTFVLMVIAKLIVMVFWMKTAP